MLYFKWVVFGEERSLIPARVSGRRGVVKRATLSKIHDCGTMSAGV
ncbi:hypothetical protein MAE02_69110 [Microvirga aerophila]|uniref:Uncharacterized protein n=1 Tax=Microvirga aerophila TaxID=670291 RepID=A0A512C4U7_9HYPH|nr:hypothetical protein MAE02_69110 [Microvirga aerophila]